MTVSERVHRVLRKVAGKLDEVGLRLPQMARQSAPSQFGAKPASDVVPPTTTATFDTAFSSVGGFGAWHEKRKSRRLQMTEQSDLAALPRIDTPAALRCLPIADNIVAHRFGFLGAGEFSPVDPDRGTNAHGYRPIDWFLDPVRNLRFPSDVPYRSWDLFGMRPGNADIKYPWELARCQHFLALAQAYAVSTDHRYAMELADQCADFIAANPVGIGINWTCTMDIALRAANWCFALNLVSSCSAIDAERWERIYRHLFETGCFILENLENKYEVTSNHFLSNVVGLHVLAAEFEGLGFASQWDAYVRDVLEVEIVAQILPDGADYESSIPYHRLVTELFLGAWRLTQIQGRPLSENFRARLVAMVEFLEAVLRPDGAMPTIGDADDGRLMIATGYGEWRPADARHVMAPAALALDLPELLDRAGDDAPWEAFWWGFSPREYRTAVDAAKPGPSSGVTERLFPDAGIVVSRSMSEGAYLLVSNGIVGTEGFGNHKHNDLLSFEYCDRNKLLIVDPGSYVYTSDFDQRNAFRATSRHNTLVLDGVEQNDIRPDYLFRMFAKATPDHRRFEATDDGVRYDGSHDGYEVQLDDGVRHRRTFAHSIRGGGLDIADELTGSGRHEGEWYFHFAPGVEASIRDGARSAIICSGGLQWRLSWDDPGLAATIIDSAVSPSYGIIHPALTLLLKRQVSLAANPYAVAFSMSREEMT